MKKRGMGLPDLRKDITGYTLIAAVAAELISLPFLGPNILFPYGLALGICAALIALYVISVSIDRAVARGKRSPVFLGFFIRMLLYGGALWLAVRTSGISGAGAAIGLLLPQAALRIRLGLVPAIRRKLGREPAAVYRTDTRSRVFVKEPWLVRYNKGRMYLTHRHYRKVRVVSGMTGTAGKDRR